MAKKSAKKRPTARAKKPAVEKTPLLSKAAKQDIAALLGIGVSVLLIIAFFGGAGALGVSLMNGLK